MSHIIDNILRLLIPFGTICLKTAEIQNVQIQKPEPHMQ